MASRNHNSIDFNPYEVLSLEKDCTDAQIVRAFRKAALKWHPDKNPERQDFAQQMFLKISKAFEVLSDAAARSAYDHVLATTSARSVYVKRRQQNESENRRKLREDLERREASTFSATEEEANARRQLEREIERLRKEGSKLLQHERENIEREVHQRVGSETRAGQSNEVAQLRLKWKRSSTYDYNRESLEKIFSQYGNVTDIVISEAGKGSAIIEFNGSVDIEALKMENGDEKCPIVHSWLSEPKNIRKEIKEQPSKEQQKIPKRSMSANEFADFEAEILASMMGGKKSKNTDLSKCGMF